MLLPAFAVLVSGVLSLRASVKLNQYVTVEGLSTRVGDRTIHQFTGIPYATRETLLTRPKAVVYPDRKKVTIDATTPGFVCPSDTNWSASLDGFHAKLMHALTDVNGAVQDGLKCTSLDIYVPATPGKKAIVVFVHGGALNFGARNQAVNRADQIHRFDEFAETMWVSVGYSLGPLGFWAKATEDGGIEANAALHEIILALLWVHAYAASFGGDLDNITLMGHSAGAALAQDADFALRNPAYHGFGKRQPFHKLILMSGTSYLFPPIGMEEALARQQQVIDEAGCRKARDPLACLQRLSGKEIMEAASRAKFVGGPVIDNDALLGDADFHLRNGLFLKKVSVLITTAAEECGMHCSELKEDIMTLGHGIWEHLGHGDLVRDFKSSYPSSNFGGCNYQCAIRCTTDAVFVGPALDSANYYREGGRSVYTYELSCELERLHALVSLLNGAMELGNVVAKVLRDVLPPEERPLVPVGFELLGQLFSPKAKKPPLPQVSEMGTFHGLDLALLFDANVSKNGAYHVGLFTSREKAIAAFQPFFDFIFAGIATTKPPRENLFPTQCVDVPLVVRKLYTGEAKASLAARKAAVRP